MLPIYSLSICLSISLFAKFVFPCKCKFDQLHTHSIYIHTYIYVYIYILYLYTNAWHTFCLAFFGTPGTAWSMYWHLRWNRFKWFLQYFIVDIFLLIHCQPVKCSVWQQCRWPENSKPQSGAWQRFALTPRSRSVGGIPWWHENKDMWLFLLSVSKRVES